MAILDRPEDINLEENSLGLEDGSPETNASLDGLVGWIEGRYNRSNDSRQSDETRWLTSYRNYRGLYGPDVKFTDNEKSQAFIKITKTKVLAAYAQVVDVLFAGSKFPIGIDPSYNPVGVSGPIHFDPKEVTEEKLNEMTGGEAKSSTIARPELLKNSGPLADQLSRVEDQLREGAGRTPTALTFEPAKEAARKMERTIHDQLEESNANKLPDFIKTLVPVADVMLGIFSEPLNVACPVTSSAPPIVAAVSI